MRKQKLNILQILPSLNSGGVERGTVEVANFLKKSGYGSFVISAGGRLVENLEKNGTKHFCLKIGKKSLLTFLLIPKLINFFYTNNIDIVHVRSRFPAWIVYLALKFIKKEKKPNLVTSVHGFNSVSFYSSIMLKGDKVIVVSRSLLKFLNNHYQFDKKKIHVIHRGVPKEFNIEIDKTFLAWKENFYKEFNLNYNTKILLLPVRISKHKGIEFFLDLIFALKNKNIDVVGFIVGEAKSSSYLKKINQRICHLDIQEKIFIPGYRSDIYNIMKISSITYSLSLLPEAFGRTVIESIRLGTPVLGFDHGGVGEQLKEIFPNGLVEVFNSQKLIKKTISYLDNRPKLKKVHSFVLEDMLKETIDVYKSFNNI